MYGASASYIIIRSSSLITARRPRRAVIFAVAKS